MESPKTSIRQAESWITEEHLEIRCVLDRLQTMTDPYMMLLVLKDLRDKQEAHFSREEGDEGLHAIIEPYAPHHERQVDELLREHRFLNEELDALIKECSELLAGPLARLKTGAGLYIDKVQAHAVAETEILTDSVLGEMERSGFQS